MLNNNKIAFVAGCFDSTPDNLPHSGHKFLLTKMRELVGEEGKVIIGLNRDEYIIDYKKRQPLSNWAERKRALLLTREVNHVDGFYCNPIDLIMFFKPDFIFVGDDRTEKEVIGHDICDSWGGKVIIVKRLPGISTTEIIQKQKNNSQ